MERAFKPDEHDVSPELTHVSRVALLGEISGSIAHELNQPLSAILSNAETAQKLLDQSKLDPKELAAILADIIEDATRAAEIINLLRSLERKSKADFTTIDMHQIVEDVVHLLGAEAIKRQVHISVAHNDPLPVVWGNRVQLEQVLLNLVLNAFDALGGNAVGERHVSITTHTNSECKLTVEVRDNGEGLGSHRERSIFEPFVSSKADGLGLGLSICSAIIAAHDGNLSAENNTGRGATVSFTLKGANNGHVAP